MQHDFIMNEYKENNKIINKNGQLCIKTGRNGEKSVRNPRYKRNV